MESPFFYSADPWSAAARRRGARDNMESPIFYSADPRAGSLRYRRTPAPEPAAKPRVVSIPVRFVGSDDAPAPAKPAVAPPSEAARSAAAAAIQRVFRGHLVRKNVSVVSRIAAEAGEIERRVRAEEDRLRADPKERLRVGEMLMALLLRLDSVRGVREYRKKVIRGVIALQEFLDSISAETLESQNSIESEAPIPAEMHPENPDPDAALAEAEEMPQEDKFSRQAATDADAKGAERQDSDSTVAEGAASQESQDAILTVVEDADARERERASDASCEGLETLDYVDDLKSEDEKAGGEGFAVVSMEEATDTTPTKANLEAELVCDEATTGKASVFDSMEQESGETMVVPAEEAPEISTTMVETAAEEAGSHMAGDSMQATAEPGQDSAGASGMEEVLKRVMTDSQRLQGMVAALCERSAQQCRLMAGLVERVEHLEWAVQKLEKKKKSKKKSAKCSLASPVDKKCSQTKQ